MPKTSTTLTKEQEKLALEIQEYILTNLLYEFNFKHLARNFERHLFSKFSLMQPSELEIAPRNYDTAWYIKTSRSARKGYGAYGVGQMRFKEGSYALNLNKVGSEFEVFKKKKGLPPHLARKTIAQLGEQHLERVKIYPHNHKGYLTQAIFDSVMKFYKNHRDTIEGVKIWLPM